VRTGAIRGFSARACLRWRVIFTARNSGSVGGVGRLTRAWPSFCGAAVL